MIKLTEDLKLQVKKKEYKLTRTEYLVMKYLLENKEKLVAGEEIAAAASCDPRYAKNILIKFRNEFGLKIVSVSRYVFQEI